MVWRCEVEARTGLGGWLVRWPCWLLILCVGAVQTSGASPLCAASYFGHVEVVRALLGAGADVGQATVSRGFSWGVGKCGV